MKEPSRSRRTLRIVAAAVVGGASAGGLGGQHADTHPSATARAATTPVSSNIVCYGDSLRANRPEPSRLTVAKYTAKWPHYFQSIEHVTKLQFMTRGRVIAETASPESAAVTTRYAQEAFRLLAPGHGFVNGTRLHFTPPDRVPSAISPYRFHYVTDASNDSFAVSETRGGKAGDLGGEAGPGLTAYRCGSTRST